MEPHDEFLELCAVSTSGDLSKEEQKRLEEHLAGCSECRQALSEFKAVADFGVPLLFSELSEHATPQPSLITSEANKVTILPFVHRHGHERAGGNWSLAWLLFAAAILLIFALGIYAYRTGRGSGLELARVTARSADAKVEALEQQMSDVGHEREILEAQLAERERAISGLRREIEVQSASLNAMRTAQANLNQSIKTDKEAKQQVAKENSTLAQQLDAAQASLDKTQAELDAVEQQRMENQARVAGLKAQDDALSAQLSEQSQTIGEQDDLLAHDRDIRELMGARDLYITEIYDVARDGKTKKPFGRIFYTKGKSLVFYAYDLDQQVGLKKANTFQAWGRRGPDRQQALNLGIFYEDNAAKKRWVLKFANPRKLAEIDAVFVTVEPKGGSYKPSGKPLLFAYLKVNPNHP